MENWIERKRTIQDKKITEEFKVQVDNSSNFREFMFENKLTMKDGSSKKEEVFMQLDVESKTLTVNGVRMQKEDVDVLLQFLGQIK